MTHRTASRSPRLLLVALSSAVAWGTLTIQGGIEPPSDEAEASDTAVDEARPSDDAPGAAPSAGRAAEADAAGSTQAASAQGLPFDLQSVVGQVRLAYRPTDEAGRFAGGSATYTVEVDGAGATLRAYHVARSQRPSVRPEDGPEDGRPPEAPVEVLEGAPLHVGLGRVRRGSASLAVVPATPGVVEEGHLEIARGPLTEVFRNAAEGVEQSWRFERAPSGSGDLAVRVAVNGLQYAGSTASGLHFADPSSGLGFRYGHGTWIDRDGHRTSVEARRVAGGVELVVPAAVLEASTYPAVLDPTISPEIGMDEPVAGSALVDQTYASVASNGTDYLVVWQDFRGPLIWDIYGARVSSAGVLLDAGGILLCSADGWQEVPRVASDGTDFLVVWQDGRSGGGIYGTRVSAAGAVLDPSGLAISTGAGFKGRPDVTSNGTGYFVVWYDGRDGTGADIYAARVDAGGTVLDPDGIEVTTLATVEAYPRVASDGTDYLIAWQDARNDTQNDIYGARVTGDGVVSDPNGLEIGVALYRQSYPTVASNGTSYLVAWETNQVSAYDVYGTTISSEGVVSNPGGVPLGAATSTQRSPSAASNGTGYLVAWHDARSGAGSQIYATRTDAAGVVTDPGGILVSVAATDYYPSVASNGSDYFVAWQTRGGNDNQYDAVGARLSSAGVVLDAPPVLISTAANGQSNPDVAFNGSDFLVVWEDFRAGSEGDIHGARVSSAGTVLDTTGLALCTEAERQSRPAVASSGDEFLVVWEDLRGGGNPDVYGTRVGADGSILEPAGLPIATQALSEMTPAVASNGTDYLVVWSDSTSGTGWNIYGSRITSAGVVVDATPLQVATSDPNQLEPSVASNGTDYLVAWHESGLSTGLDVYAARVTAGGVILDATAMVLAANTATNREPTVASNGADYMVVWNDSSGGAGGDVYGTEVGSDGVVSDPSGIPVASAVGAQSAAALAPMGSDYLIVWRDTRSGSGYDLYGNILVGGVPQSTVGAPYAADPTTDEGIPRLAAGSGGTFLLVYDRYVSSPATGAVRARARLLSNFGSGLGESCLLGSDCETGFCVDGVCCNDACGGNVGGDCQACAAAFTGGTDGDCAPLSAALAPSVVCRAQAHPCDIAEVCRDDSTSCPADFLALFGTPCGDPSDTTCSNPDICNGEGVCVPNHASTAVVCRAPSCASGMQTAGANCDGAGACPTAVTPCDPYVCGAIACLTSCTIDTDCVSGRYCDGGACVPLLAQGTACSEDRQCAGGPCIDGYCCEEACTGQCEACGESGSEGTCVAVTGAPRGGRAPCASDDSSCGGACGGVDPDGCAYPAAETSCRAASCAAGVATVGTACVGSGTCPVEQTAMCAPYACDAAGTSCRGDCTLHAHCEPGNFCLAGVCTATLVQGTACGEDAQCSSAHCVDGFCCDGPCTGQCEACGESGTEGTCMAVTGAARGGRTPCTGAGTTCQGICDGVEPASCAYPDDTVTCDAARCDGDMWIDVGACGGDGTCVDTPAVHCTHGCVAEGCLECSTDDDCDVPATCNAGYCVMLDAGVDGGTDIPSHGCGCRAVGSTEPGTPAPWPTSIALLLFVLVQRRGNRPRGRGNL